MTKYIVKRCLQAIPVIILITIICFALMNMAPYDAVDAVAEARNLTREQTEQLRQSYGLDQPVYVQYVRWVQNLCRGELGVSLTNKSDIMLDLRDRLPATLRLAVPAYLTAVILAVILGLTAGNFKNKWPDKLIDGLCSIGIATPTFWFALLVMYFLGYRLDLFPLMGMYTIGGDRSFTDFLQHFFMPYLVLTVGYLPSLTRYIRSSTIGQIGEDYVTVQLAYGSRKSQILFRHVLKNVSLPLIAKMAVDIPLIITGAVVTETIFSWPGIGTYFTKAVQALDYPVVMIILVMTSVLTILGNLLADIMYCVIDPRIKTMR